MTKPYALLCVPCDDCLDSGSADCGELMLVCNDIGAPYTFFSKSSAVQFACDMLAPDMFFFTVHIVSVNLFHFPTFQL